MPTARTLTIWIAALYLLLAGATAARGEQEQVEVAKLPPPVLKAVKAKFPESQLESALKEIEGKEFVYEVCLKCKRREMYVLVDPEGNILEIDKVISEKELPGAVVATLKKKYAEAKVSTAEEILIGEEISYSVLLKFGPKRTLHVHLDPKGKVLEENDYATQE